jgi:hypothetical protein
MAMMRLILIVVATMLLSAGAARADLYGAISLSPANGATGWSFDFTSRWEAEDVSQRNCYRHASDCRVAIWFKNACGAVARGPQGWGADWAETPYLAQSAALASCARHSGGCRVIRWQCSGAR